MTDEDYDRDPKHYENTRESIMSQEIIQSKARNTLTLIWAGNYHTDLSRTKTNHKSMVVYLQENSIPFTKITFLYGRGNYYNYGKKRIPDNISYDSYHLEKISEGYNIYVPNPTAANVKDF